MTMTILTLVKDILTIALAIYVVYSFGITELKDKIKMNKIEKELKKEWETKTGTYSYLKKRS